MADFFGLGWRGNRRLPRTFFAEEGWLHVIEYMHFPAQLREPGRRHVGPYAIIIDQHQACAAHTGEVVGFLHQLAAGCGTGSGQVTGFEFFRGAYVEQVSAAARFLLPALHVCQRGTAHPRFIGHATGIAGGNLPMLFAGWRELARLTVLQFLTGQGPANGAVAQGRHRVGDAGVDQRLRADDAAGAAGAVDDDARGRVRCQLPGAQHQFGARYADAGGNAHGLVFIEAPGIEHYHVGVVVEQCLDFLCRKRRRVALAFHQFAEGFAWHIDVDEQLATGVAPTVQSVFKQADIEVAQVLQALSGDARQTFAIVVDGHLGIAPWNPRVHLQLKFRQGNIGREQRVRFGKGCFFAHIHQCQFFTVQQGLAYVGVSAGECSTHRAWLSLDKSQMLGRKALE